MAGNRSQEARKERTSSLMAELPRYGIVAAAVVLAWQVVRTPVEERAPPAVAIRLSPTSPLVLRRAAEEELAAGRMENARSLAAESLTRDPFSARALRVLGLTYARSDENGRADDLLTLAGNWSLRDDPAHAWLVEHRLRQGQFGSAFAHADTLARRRADLHPELFRLFVVAADSSPQGLTALASLLARTPPWRDAFLEHLHGIPEGDSLLGSLALSLRAGEGRFTDIELAHLYLKWAGEGRTAGLKYLRSQLGRPSLDKLIQDGSFSGPPAPAPFAWVMAPAPGLTADITADETNEDNQALRVQFRGLNRNEVSYQLLLLEPGRYQLQGRIRVQEGSGELPLAWTIACVESTEVLADLPIVAPVDNDQQSWVSFDRTLVVPATRCTGQWLRLVTRPGDRRTTAVAWTDDLRLSRAD